MVKVGEILTEHRALTAGYIIDQLGDVFGDRVTVEVWRRGAAAVDRITGTDLQ